MQERKYDVGDRVVGVGEYGHRNIDGKQGTVKRIINGDVAVHFDDDIGGWGTCGDFFGLHIPDGHGLFVHPSHLRPLPAQPKRAASSIHITADGMTTHAIQKNGRSSIRAEAVCGIGDTYAFQDGAAWAFLRLPGMMDAVERVLPEMKLWEAKQAKLREGRQSVVCTLEKVQEVKAEAKPKHGLTAEECKPGMRVKFIDEDGHKSRPEYYPAVGTIGEIIQNDGAFTIVQWPNGSTSGDGLWGCRYERIELADDPKTELSPEQDKPKRPDGLLYDVGDKVLIGTVLPAYPPERQKYAGKIMTIRGYNAECYPTYDMEEDIGEHKSDVIKKDDGKYGWFWKPEEIVGKVVQQDHYEPGDEVVVKQLKNGETYEVKGINRICRWTLTTQHPLLSMAGQVVSIERFDSEYVNYKTNGGWFLPSMFEGKLIRPSV